MNKIGNTLKFVPVDTPSVVIIELDELVSTGGDKFLEIGYADDNEIPKTISVNYVAKTADYQQGTQEAIRQIVDTGEAETISVAVVLENTVARELAEKILYLRWTRRVTYNFALTVEYFVLLNLSFCHPRQLIFLIYLSLWVPIFILYLIL